jgi:hypothetical protein
LDSTVCVSLQVKEGALICGYLFALFYYKETSFSPSLKYCDALPLNINLFGFSLSYSSLSPQLGGMGFRVRPHKEKKGEIIAKEKKSKNLCRILTFQKNMVVL